MDPPWYETFFDERYLNFYPVLREQPLASSEAASVVRLLGLEPRGHVLDLGCGTGRHSVALALLGFQVSGLDLSAPLLKQARETAAAHQAQVTWLQRDMRDLEDLGPFDACISLYTAFGLLGDEEDREVLNQVAAVLRPGGGLLLDLTNFVGYLGRMPRDIWRETPQALLRERNEYEAATGFLVTHRTCFLKEGGRQDLPASRVRAYLPHEILAMLRGAGLHVEQMLGGLDGVPYSCDSSPCQVYLCRRAGPR